MNKAFLSLGSNEGNRLEWFKKALELIDANCGDLVRKSSIYETAAWGITDQPSFLNMVVIIETVKTPAELLTEILKTETMLGRERTIKWGPRRIDIDILFYNDEILELPGLIIPHPYLQDRRFTLTPLVELAPDYVHPKLHKTMTELLADCQDKLEVVISRKS